MDKSKIQVLLDNIRQWAEDRNLIKGSTPQAQFCKLVEECGKELGICLKEVSRKIQFNKDEDMKPIIEMAKDSIGDSLVVLTIIYSQYHYLNPSHPILLSEDLEEFMLDGYEVWELDSYEDCISMEDFEKLDRNKRNTLFEISKLSTNLLVSLGEIGSDIARKKPLSGETFIEPLVIISQRFSLSIEECLEQAWNEIKDRKGKMVDGAFIKEADFEKLGITP